MPSVGETAVLASDILDYKLCLEWKPLCSAELEAVKNRGRMFRGCDALLPGESESEEEDEEEDGGAVRGKLNIKIV